MFDIDKWQEIFSAIEKHKLRTILTAFGVFWGIFMLVALLGIGKGLEKGVLNNFKDRAVNSLYIWGDKTSIPYKGQKPGHHIKLTNDDTKALLATFEEIEFLAPRLQLWGDYTINRKTKSGSFSVYGDNPEFGKIKSINLTEGRFINALDINQKRKTAVIGPRIKDILFEPDENPINQYIRIKGIFYKVVGIFNVEISGSGRDDSETIYIPFSTMQQAYNYGNRVGWYAMTIKTNVSVKQVQSNIKAFLSARHNVSPEDTQAIGSWNASKVFNDLTGLFRGINIFLWIVGIGTIIAGIVGVSNIMLIIVKERTKEIGIRKAIGATPWSIISLIVQESIIITAFSGYVGLVAGVGILEFVNIIMNTFNIENGYFSNPEIDFKIAILATIILAISGTLAGLFPAHKAAKIKPIEALRDE